jgi:chromosome condensin MukBEF ATPase and DNA-binding subunit MukB
MYAGTLEAGLVPRGGFMNDPDANRELSRMVEEVARLRRQLDEQQQAHDQALAAKQSEVDSAQQAVQALGKAIALLHAGNESADSTTGS